MVCVKPPKRRVSGFSSFCRATNGRIVSGLKGERIDHFDERFLLVLVVRCSVGQGSLLFGMSGFDSA
jgi:hypothetical protein